MKHTYRTVGLLVLGAFVAGCTAPRTADRADQPAARPASEPAAQPARTAFRSTIARSALREQAITVLQTLSVSNDPQTRANALEALMPARTRLRGPVAAGLADENEGVRAVAAVIAGRAGIRDLAPQLRGLLSDPSPYVRVGSMYALRAMRQNIDLTPMSVLLLESPDPRLRAQTAFLLGELGDDSALPMLRQALHQRLNTATEEQRRLLELQIAEAMVKLGDDSGLEGIRAALYPAYPNELELATLAVQILGRLGDKSSIGSLINLSEYRQGGRKMPAEIRLAVAEAVGRMGRREGWFIAEEYIHDQDPLKRALAARVLGQTRRAVDLATLRTMMDDPSEAVRVAAAGAVLEATSPGGRLEAGIVP